ncbi:hypothetical protein FRB95_002416 [Tulasnella sp. JGI-2019a]|nr:hypothetical protein FRB95_002416 [Tulasnella sp. JGI-2019a]
MVEGYYSQADDTLKETKEALARKDLDKLSSPGSFLKGSSPVLGATKVHATREKIQHNGVSKTIEQER